MTVFVILDKRSGQMLEEVYRNLRAAKEAKQELDRYKIFMSNERGLPYVSQYVIAKVRENQNG